MANSELVKRVAAAAVLIPVVIGITWWENTLPLAIGIYLFILMGNREIFNIFRSAGEPVSLIITLLGALLIPLCFFLGNSWLLFGFVFTALIIVVFLLKLFSESPTGDTVRYVSVNTFAAVFFPLLFSFIWLLRTLPAGALWIFYLFVVIWISDSAAYFIGSKIGKRHIVPRVSPKKSLEGFIGGFVCGMAAGLVFYYLAIHTITPLSPVQILIITVDIVIAGMLGDLFESMLKRNAGVKDSGKLIPGHGGVLDRVDSLIFAAPVLFMYLTAWG